MVSALEVPANELIGKLSGKLRKEGIVKPPQWARFVKTGPHVKRKPHAEVKEWWYIRCASILRKIYTGGNIGVGRLRIKYGGRKKYGTSPEHHVNAGGSIIRKALQQLESAGYIKKAKTGRVLTPKGRSFLEKTAIEIIKTKPKKKRKPKVEVKGEEVGIEKPARPKPAKVPSRAPKKGTGKATDKGAGAKPAGTKSKRKVGKSKAGES